MSPRIIIASFCLTLCLAGGATILLLGGGSEKGDPSTGFENNSRSQRESTRNSDSPGESRHGKSGLSNTDDLIDAVGHGEGRNLSGRITTRSGASGSRRPGGSEPKTGSSTGGSGTSSDSGSRNSATSGNGRDPSEIGSGKNRSSSNSRRRNGGSTSAETTGQASGTNGASEAELGPTITISGNIIAVDPEGQQFPEESGSLELRITAPGYDELRDIAVVSGSWSAQLPDRSRVKFVSGQLRERSVNISPSHAISVSDGLSIQLTGEWTSETLLHVRSRATGETLCDQELVRISDWMRNSRPHPGAVTTTDQRWTTECSPIPLATNGVTAGTSVPYHVYAPGHAWGRILLDTTTGGDREILLDAGGNLEVTFTGGWQRPGALLRLRVLGENQPYGEVAILGESMMIKGILPGSYEISVETGSWAQNPLVLGTVEVVVSVGEITILELSVNDLEDEERVPFGGTVFVPTEWLLDEFQLRIRPIDPGRNIAEETQHIPNLEMTATPIPGGTLYGWEADAVEPGNFGLLVLPIGYGINVHVDLVGNLEAEISLPAPVPVEVRTLVAGTAEPAFPNLIRWTPARDPGVPGAGALTVPPENNSNVFLFDAPLGAVIISSSDSGFRPASRQLQLTPDGPNTFEFELQPAHGLSILLYDGETPVPWDIGWHAHLTPMEGTQGQVVTRGRVGINYRILVSNPGWYTLTMPEIDGFLPVAPLQVEVIESTILDVDIPLLREP